MSSSQLVQPCHLKVQNPHPWFYRAKADSSPPLQSHVMPCSAHSRCTDHTGFLLQPPNRLSSIISASAHTVKHLDCSSQGADSRSSCRPQLQALSPLWSLSDTWSWWGTLSYVLKTPTLFLHSTLSSSKSMICVLIWWNLSLPGLWAMWLQRIVRVLLQRLGWYLACTDLRHVNRR